MLLGIDIGGTKLAIAIGDAQGRIFARARRPTAPSGDPIRDVAAIVRDAHQLLRENDVRPETVECVCALDPRCCTETWDKACATLACSGACQDVCGDFTLGPTEECEQDADCDGAETCASDCTCEL